MALLPRLLLLESILAFPITFHPPRQHRQAAIESLFPLRSKRKSQPIPKPKGFGTTRNEPKQALNEVIPSEPHTDLLSRLHQHPQTYISPKFTLLPSSLGGYGAFSQTALQPGELLLRIPRTCCITLQDAIHDTHSGTAFEMLREARVKDWGLLLIAGWIAKEYLRSEKETGKHWDYLKTLPWRRGVLDQDHILFWSEGEMDTLKGSLAYEDAVLLRTRVGGAIRLMNDLIFEPLFVKGDLTCTADGPKGWIEVVTGAFVIALSRSFAEEVEYDVDGTTTVDTEIVLLPLIDMLQHSDHPNTSLESYPDCILLKAARGVGPGEELFHRYREEVVPGWNFFTRYGFVPGVREPIADLLGERSPIFFDSG